ncbi:L-alanine-DL-glutamate epimerase [Spirosomataceae bacterium TFI 002]|nr:L-alanine-DL-glutamate epimerase [Spirosomataceae bacterium TFI 002]
MKINLHAITLENKGAFKIAHGSRTHTDTLIVGLEKDGITGWGEAAHVPYYGIDVERSVREIQSFAKDSFLDQNPSHEAFNDFLVEKLKGNHFAICAMDMAYWDLRAKQAEKTLSDYILSSGLLKQPAGRIPFSSFTIGIGTADEMAKKAKATDFPIIKVKLGTAEDDKLIRAIRKATNATLRIDANTGWRTSEAIYLSEVMNENGVEFIEQPFARDAYEEMSQLRQSVKAIFIADESCKFEADLEKCIGAFDGINIKLSKCGGITPTLRMIDKARNVDMKLMLGCMTESSIGISALSHLLPFVDYADLDGALLIKNDPAVGVKIVKGEAIFRGGFGHGGGLK